MADPQYETYENRLIQGDNLDVARGMPEESVDLCYIDPPFGTGRSRKGIELGLSTGGRSRRSGEGQEFAYNDGWTGGIDAYVGWMRPRLDAFLRVLKPNGSLLVHVDWRASHYVKVLLDELAGRQRFVNEIVWHYATGGGRTARRLARKHDVILWYSRGEKYTCNLDAVSRPRHLCRLCGRKAPDKNHMKRTCDENGRAVRTIKSAGREYRYYDDDPAPLPDVWLDIAHLQQRSPERTGYPTQKPLALLERLVLLCSNEEDLVADFFMGTGTALVAAARLGRRWFGCDASPDAVELAKGRLP